MISTEQSTRETSGYEPLFSYGHLRAHYVGSYMDGGALHVKQFVRHEHIEALRDNLLVDSALLSSSKSILSELQLTPVSRQCLWELQSGIMLRVLENITGLHNLLADTRRKQTHLLMPPAISGLNNWHDADTGLDVALVLLIQLDSGDAQFCTNAQSLGGISTGTASLQVSYWQHNLAGTGGAQS